MSVKIKHYICPKRSGKSTAAQKIFTGDPEEAVLINVLPDTDLKHIYENYIKGCTFKKVIIDDFLELFKNNKGYVRRLMNYFLTHGAEEITLFSTPDRLYNPIRDKKELKSKFLDSSEVSIICGEFYHAMSKNDRMKLTTVLPSYEFQTKVLGVLYDNAIQL